jgi:hypothetical protein
MVTQGNNRHSSQQTDAGKTIRKIKTGASAGKLPEWKKMPNPAPESTKHIQKSKK